MKRREVAGLEALRERWVAAWPAALEAWSRFTRLRPPVFCLSHAEARREGLSESFAMIRLQDQAIIVDLESVRESGVDDFAVEVLAHEIGHHVLAPANLTDHARSIARMRWALPTVEDRAPMVANLYTDLLINDRLERSAGLAMGEVYRTLGREAGGGGALWALYLRIYEILWSLPRQALGGDRTDDRIEGDAWLGARLVRSYRSEWIGGAGRFAALLLPYLLEDSVSESVFRAMMDTRGAGAGGEVSGLSDEEPGERDGAMHPALDPELTGLADEAAESSEAGDGPSEGLADEVAVRRGGGQTRQPFEYGEILRAAGLALTDHDVAVRFYREKALPHLVPFPSRPVPRSTDPLPEGLEPWEAGHPLDAVDWFQSVIVSPRVIPGVTTVQRVWGTTEGREPERQPLDLDLYVDSSGSMENPQVRVSYPALAGAILALSALRAGARVQATLWSGKNQVQSTAGFVRDETAILRVLTGFFGGATAFPLPTLRETWSGRRPEDPPGHILVVSDDGVSTMFDTDERGMPGWDVAGTALEQAGGGGTMVLQIPPNWDDPSVAQEWMKKIYGPIRRARDVQGWDVHRVASWEDLVEFARDFSRRTWAEDCAVTVEARAR